MAEKKKKPPSLGVREIVREQVQLTKTEADLKKMIGNINDHINQLLVEELQLKSGLMLQKPSESSGKLTPARSMSDHFDATAIINEQRLHLYAPHSQMEEDDDDD